jgi:predicted amidohydrolase
MPQRSTLPLVPTDEDSHQPWISSRGPANGQAHRAGARIIHFPEGAACSPHKRIMSVTGPAEVGPADWGRADWQALRQELAAIARLAGELRLWTVLGSVHPLTPPHRPHNSMYVISDQGELVTRYDGAACGDDRRHRQPVGVHRHRRHQGPSVAAAGTSGCI